MLSRLCEEAIDVAPGCLLVGRIFPKWIQPFVMEAHASRPGLSIGGIAERFLGSRMAAYSSGARIADVDWLLVQVRSMRIDLGAGGQPAIAAAMDAAGAHRIVRHGLPAGV